MSDELPKIPSAASAPSAVPAVIAPQDPRDIRADAVMAERPREASRKLFVGFRIAVPVANGLAGAAETLARRARDGSLAPLLRWVHPANYHVTLKYLGATREAAIPALRDALAAAVARMAPLRITTHRLGAFDGVESARVIWAGVEDAAGALTALASAVDVACVALGYPAETRGFHGHVTLARLREPRPVRELILPLAEQGFGDTRVEALTLFASDTRPSGPVYRDVARLAFGRADGLARASPTADIAAAPTFEVETDDGWPRGHIPNL